MKAVYIQHKSEGLNRILLYLSGEKIPYVKYLCLAHKPWLTKIAITGRLAEWNFRRILDMVNQTDLSIEYDGKHIVIYC